MQYNAPKSILKCTGVRSCTSGYAQGGDQPHYVQLEDDYWFGDMYQTSDFFFMHIREPKTRARRLGRSWENMKHNIEKRP